VDGVEGAFLLHNVLTLDECNQFVEVTEKMGYEDALITTFGGMVMMKDVRDNKRVMWQTEGVKEKIWERIKSFMPQDTKRKGGVWQPIGLNERFRFYKYEAGQSFSRHFDGCFPRSADEMSLLTFIVYLSDGFEGGCTTFYVGGKEISVNPVKGSALIFWHGPSPLSPEHEGSACKKGEKHVLRSDVMFKLIPGTKKTT